jgi:septal ring factor EnvC (AmiA/AmiB activator)
LSTTVAPLARATALLLAIGVAWAAGGSSQPTVEQQEASLARLRERIDGLKLEEQATRDEHDALLRDLELAEKRIGELTRELREVGRQLAEQRQRAKETAAGRTQAQARLDRERTSLDKQLRAAFRAGRQERLQLMLRQEDPAVASRMSVYYDYFHRARAARVGKARDAAAELASAELAARTEAEKLAALQELQNAEKVELEESRAIRQSAIAALSAQLRERGEELARLGRDEARTQALLQRLREALVELPAEIPGAQPFSTLKGRLPWPSAGRVAARFGEPKAGVPGVDGVLIGAKAGADVRAIHHGRVAFADWLRGFGLLVIVDHGDGYMSLYGHNESLLKEVGEWVGTGEPIGLAGTSGGLQSTTVYFGIRHQGKALDPADWCRRGQRDRVG